MSKCVIKKTLEGIAEAIKEAKPGSVELKVLEQYKEDLQKLAADRGIDLKSTTTLDNLPNRRSTKGDMNHTGGAYGADSIWANLLRPYGVVNVHYRPINDKPPKGVATLKNAGDKIVGITDEENNAGNALNTKIGNSATELNNRNLVQVYNADKVFAVAPIVNGKVTGGTGSAVRLAEHLNREVYVLNTEDVQWYKAKDGKYVKIDYVPKIEGNFAAVGTRKIEQYSTPVKDKNGNVLEWKKSELVSNYKEVINAMKAAVDASYGKETKNNVRYQVTTADMQTSDVRSDKLFNKIKSKLEKTYPEIKLEFTDKDIEYVYIDGSVMNQKEYDNKVNLTLRLIDTLYALGTAKPSQYGGESQPVRKTVRADTEQIRINMAKMLASRGVPKEQIELMFEYMKQNDIAEIDTLQLAERLSFGVVAEVEITTGKERETITIPTPFGLNEEDVPPRKRTIFKNSSYYKNLSVPGGTNYRELEIRTPGTEAVKEGHASFATGDGIGWYRVDEEVIGGKTYKLPNVFTDVTGTVWNRTTEGWELTYPGEKPVIRYDLTDSEASSSYQEKIGTVGGTATNTLRVLEMQSDMFQKMKDLDLMDTEEIHEIKQSISNIEGVLKVRTLPVDERIRREFRLRELKHRLASLKVSTPKNLNNAFSQMLNTDNKWVRFFIQSIVQNAERNGYKSIQFPAGETAAKIEGLDTLIDIIGKKTKKLDNINNAIPKHKDELEKAKIDKNEYKIARLEDSLQGLIDEKVKVEKELKESSVDKLAPIEAFYQNRVKNTLLKTYGRQNIKEITDEYGNKWFELKLDKRRDSQNIMFQRVTGVSTSLEIKGKKRDAVVFDIKNVSGDSVGETTINESNSLSSFLYSSDVAKSATTFTPEEFKSKVVSLEDIWIEEDHRGKQYGISAINSIFEKYGRDTIIVLDAYPTDSSMTQDALVNYYKSLGFVSRMKKNTGTVVMSSDWRQINTVLQKQDSKIKGQADLAAMTVLIDERIMTMDTLPHEYAHHYVHWFRGTPIVQEAIKKWGSEEALVQAIGEQAVAQKGEAYGWWKKFSSWIKELFKELSDRDKEELKNLLTDAFLERKDLNTYVKAETKVKDGTMTTKEQQEASRLLAEAGLDATTIVASIKNDIEGCS